MLANCQVDAIDPNERLSPDDLATRREAEFLHRALLRQAAAARVPASKPGVCTNCGEACLPPAVYCDADCKLDHEARLRVPGHTGGRR